LVRDALLTGALGLACFGLAAMYRQTRAALAAVRWDMDVMAARVGTVEDGHAMMAERLGAHAVRLGKAERRLEIRNRHYPVVVSESFDALRPEADDPCNN
jgi:hypothetical protein